jgi:hypothetical protein
VGKTPLQPPARLAHQVTPIAQVDRATVVARQPNPDNNINNDMSSTLIFEIRCAADSLHPR